MPWPTGGSCGSWAGRRPYVWPVPVLPQPEAPEPGQSQKVARHLGMFCGCPLIDCGHNEDRADFESGSQDRDRTMWSGAPESGYLYPWLA
jgi:hypothetical protein